MALGKDTIKGLGALAVLGVFAAGGFFGVKPFVEQAFVYQSETKQTQEKNDMREIRLAKLTKESENMESLSKEVDSLLVQIPSSKDVSGIARAAIQALPEGVTIKAFTHGYLDPEQPAYVAPEVTLVALQPPFILVPVTEADPNSPAPVTEEAAAADEEKKAAAAPDEKASPESIPLAAAPVQVEVSATNLEALNKYMDNLQQQSRLITVMGVVASADSENGVTATVYLFSFTGETQAILDWEKYSVEGWPAAKE